MRRVLIWGVAVVLAAPVTYATTLAVDALHRRVRAALTR